jgi:type II secretory pathway pseudopilin PulG
MDSHSAGTTLVEVMATVIIASIAVSGLLTAYLDGIRTIKLETETMVMYTEGQAALIFIDRAIRHAHLVTTRQSWRESSHFLYTKGPGKQYTVDGADFFFHQSDNSLRWNDFTGTQPVFNKPLIPLFEFRQQRNEKPYIKVVDATFTAIDPDRPPNPTTEGFTLIKVNLKLAGPRGDTLEMSSIVARGNSRN